MPSFELARFPEWKALYDNILPLIEKGQKDFDYDTLTALAGLDVRSDRGRSQFYRFRRAMLKDHKLWFENVPAQGYSIIPAQQKPRAAVKRIGSARRKITLASRINSSAALEDLTPEQRLLQAATAAVLHDLSKSFYTVARKFHLASIAHQKTLPVDLQRLVASVSKPVKAIAAPDGD